jgi:hypothetical protein
MREVHRVRPLLNRVGGAWVVLIAVTVACLPACRARDESRAGRSGGQSGASPLAVRGFESPDGAYAFEYPREWSLEAIEQGDTRGVLALAPEAEAGWRANLFISVGTDELSRDVLTGSRDLATNLRSAKSGFELLGIEPVTIRRGQAARIRYRSEADGVRLTSWHVLAAPDDSEGEVFRVFVDASTAATLEQRYLPVFEVVIQSLRVDLPPVDDATTEPSAQELN